MTNVQINFPAIGFKDNDKNIYVFGKEIGLVSKGGESFYKNLTIIDSKGFCYRLKSAKVKGNASLLSSIRYFQPMKEMELEFNGQENVDLQQLKEIVFTHVSKHPKHWLVLDTLEGMKGRIYSAGSFAELIRIFR